MTLKSPCDNCLILPVCQLKKHIDVLLECIKAQEHVISQISKDGKVCDVPFPIESLQKRYMITINGMPNREWLVVSLYEPESEQFNYRSFVYYKHGGKDGKGATKRL